MALIYADIVFFERAYKWAIVATVGLKRIKEAKPEAIEEVIWLGKRVRQAKLNFISWAAIGIVCGYAITDCFVNNILK